MRACFCRDINAKIPMQLAVLEVARNVAGLKEASSTEFGVSAEPVIALLSEWMHDGNIESRHADSELGGTMRLGAYEAVLQNGTLISNVYDTDSISEH